MVEDSRSLFGGAITAKCTPDLIDASDLRQIPDTQEVLLYRNSDVSIVIEILQRVEPNDFQDAIRFHFDSLAHDNSAKDSRIDEIYVIPNDRGDDTPSAIVLAGSQSVAKFNRTTVDEVTVYMAVYRVERKNIDLVVTFNVPDASLDGRLQEVDSVKQDFDNFIKSLRIVDYSLFA